MCLIRAAYLFTYVGTNTSVFERKKWNVRLLQFLFLGGTMSLVGRLSDVLSQLILLLGDAEV